MFSSWAKKLKNFINQPSFFTVQILLTKIPGRPLQIARFFVLEFPGTTAKTMRSSVNVRKGELTDIEGMCLLENKEDLFRKRFAQGELSVVAVHDGEVVGYEWFSTKPMHVEERFNYQLEIPEDTIFAFDALIKREYRLRGIWLLFQKFKLETGNALGRQKIMTMVDYGNNPSLKAHLRFGYRVIRNVLRVRVFSKNYFLEKQLDPEIFNLKKVLV